MTPDEDAMGGVGDDPRLAESLRALHDLGDGPAPVPSEKLAAFLADPTGGAAAPAGWGWVMKEKAARLSRAGKVLVIGAGIALAGAVSATAAWQVTSVLPSHDGETPRHPAPVHSPVTDQLPTGAGQPAPTSTAAPDDGASKGQDQGNHGKDSGFGGKSEDAGDDPGKGSGQGSGKDGSDHESGSGSGKHGDDDESGSGSGSGGGGGSGSGEDSGDGGSDHGSGDDSGDHGSGRSGDHGDDESGSGDAGASPAPVP